MLRKKSLLELRCWCAGPVTATITNSDISTASAGAPVSPANTKARDMLRRYSLLGARRRVEMCPPASLRFRLRSVAGGGAEGYHLHEFLLPARVDFVKDDAGGADTGRGTVENAKFKMKNVKLKDREQ